MDEFLKLLVKLDPIEFCGVAKQLGVNLYKENQEEVEFFQREAREFQDIMVDIYDNFSKLPRMEKRRLVKLLKKVVK